ncbi:spermidine/putrescine ABC transporter permease [Halobacteriales archaeon QS_8_69_26]|nr:MAG: spermidine/putrescine ABC transporter permease [Halobacteriales archaeon QS_8_69_26]
MAAPDRDESLRATLVGALSSDRTGLGVTALPGAVWIALLLLAPLAFMTAVSFVTRDPLTYQIVWEPSLENYRDLFVGGTTEYSLGPVGFQATAFEQAMLLSYAIATVATVLCLVLAFPLAYAMTRLGDRAFKVTIYLVLLPFFTMYLVRAYSWRLMFGGSGVLNQALGAVGVGPVGLFEYGVPAIIVGLTHAYFPYMLITLYASLDGLDFSLVEAARDLGASRVDVVKDHIVPLALPGIIGGSLFVFVPSVGAFITPQILGLGTVQMIGILIERRAIGAASNAPAAGAASVIVVLTIVVALLVVFRYVDLDELGGA